MPSLTTKQKLFLLFVVLCVIVGISVGLLGEYGLFLGGVLISITLGLFVLTYPVLLLYVVILLSSSSSVFREIEITLGNTQMTLSGLFWICSAGLVLLSLLVRSRYVRLPRYLWPFVLFLIWVVGRWILTPTGFLGLKDILWYSMPVLFGIFIPLALGKDISTFQKNVWNIKQAFFYSTMIPLVFYILALSTGLAEMTWRGPRGALIGSSRGIPLFLLIVLAIALAEWRYGNIVLGGTFSFLSLSIIFFTLGRMGSALAVFTFVLSKVNPRRKWQIFIAMLFTIIVGYCAITSIPVIRQRFFFTETWNPSQGLTVVNTAGRNVIWPLIFTSAMQNPMLGHGLGTSRVVTAQLFVNEIEYLPHNEYLQIFHDTGIVGLLLLAFCWGGVFVRQWRSWEYAKNKEVKKWAMASILAIVSVLVSSITDNTFHYPIVIVPAIIVISISVGMNVRQKEEDILWKG